MPHANIYTQTHAHTHTCARAHTHIRTCTHAKTHDTTISSVWKQHIISCMSTSTTKTVIRGFSKGMCMWLSVFFGGGGGGVLLNSVSACVCVYMCVFARVCHSEASHVTSDEKWTCDCSYICKSLHRNLATQLNVLTNGFNEFALQHILRLQRMLQHTRCNTHVNFDTADVLTKSYQTHQMN